MPAAPSRAWPGTIRPYAPPGLSSCLDERRLISGGTPLLPFQFDVEALRLAEWACAGRRALILAPVDVLAPLAALIAAAIHVVDMTEYYRRTGVPAGSSRRVAVVTTDYHTRGIYRGLLVSGGQGRGSAALRAVVPAATLTRAGSVRIIDSAAGRGWSTIFVRSFEDAASMNVDVVVAEMPVDGDPRSLPDRVPMIGVVRDPADPSVTRLAEEVPVFGWSRADLAALGAATLVPPRVGKLVSGVVCRIVTVPSQSVAENAALFWSDIGPLVSAGRRSGLAADLGREAFHIFHDLMGLAAPLGLYEQAAGPLRPRLSALGRAARLTSGEVRDLYLPMAEAELEGIADAIGTDPPKHEALMRVIAGHVDDRKDVMIVARTATLARMYESVIRDHLRLRGVRVTSLGALAETPPADVAVLTGMAPTWGRWAYGAGIANVVEVLAYTPEGPLESIPDGFSEAATIERAVAHQARLRDRLSRPDAKSRAWRALSGENVPVPFSEGDDVDGADTAEVIGLKPPDVPPGLWEGGRWTLPLEPPPTQVTEPRQAGTSTIDAVVDAVRVTFTDGRWCFLDAQGTVSRLRPASAEVDHVYDAARLVAGDQVVFLDGDSRKDLLAKVLEVAGTIPAYSVAAAWIGHWRRMLATAYKRFGTYNAITQGLHRLDCTLQTQTIRLWVVGVTIGPEDEADVRRLGELMEDPVLSTQYREVHRAMRSLRGTHVRLGRRLAELARDVGTAATFGRYQSDEVIDETSGLTAGDFQDSIDVVTVVAVESVGSMPYAVTGILRDREEISV